MDQPCCQMYQSCCQSGCSSVWHVPGQSHLLHKIECSQSHHKSHNLLSYNLNLNMIKTQDMHYKPIVSKVLLSLILFLFFSDMDDGAGTQALLFHLHLASAMQVKQSPAPKLSQMHSGVLGVELQSELDMMSLAILPSVP